MDDISKQLAIRDRYRRKVSLQRSPHERMLLMARMQDAAWEVLRRSPDGYAHFLRRNYRARSVKGWDQHGG
jgi:hypothetical protein